MFSAARNNSNNKDPREASSFFRTRVKSELRVRKVSLSLTLSRDYRGLRARVSDKLAYLGRIRRGAHAREWASLRSRAIERCEKVMAHSADGNDKGERAHSPV